jgi:hypothetical protein
MKFRLSDKQLERIKKASRPVTYVVIGGMEPASPQENANAAWRLAAAELGFKWDTVQPDGDDPHDFLAEPAKP